MSKVISFSISDRYLSQIKFLYPSLTDNLAVKKFLTDRLDSSLSNSLDDSLDGILDERVKTLIETSLDGILDERLDDAVKKSVSDLSERLSRLEERLDDSLDGRLDAMEQLLKLQREASIANPPDLTSIDGSVEPANTSPLPPSPDVIDGIGDAIETLTVEDVEPVSTVETVTDTIELTNKEKAAILGIHDSNLSKWLRKGIIPNKYLDKCRFNHDKSKIILI